MAQRDIILTLAAGEDRAVPIEGADFFFLKYCDRQLGVVINDQRVNMNAGEKRRLREGIKELHVENLSDTLPLYIEAVVGDGDYEKIIVSGEITAEQKLRLASGVYIQDTRSEFEFFPAVKSADTVVEAAGVSAPTTTDNLNSDGTNVGAICYNSKNDLYYIGHSTGVYKTAHKIKKIRAGALDDYGDLEFATTDSISWLSFTYVEDIDRIYATAIKGGGGGIWFYIINPNNGSASKMSALPADTRGIAWDRNTNTLWVVNEVTGQIDEYSIGLVATGRSIDVSGVWSAGGLRSAFVDPESRLLVTVGSGTPDWPAYSLSEDTIGEYQGELLASVGAMSDAAYCNRRNVIASVFFNNTLDNYYYENLTTYGEISLGYTVIDRMCVDEAANVRQEFSLLFENYGGSYTVDGALIRAMLAQHFGGFDLVPSDYLDYIFGFEWFDGERRRKISSGGESFLRAEINDDFKMGMPHRAVITVRRGLF